MIKILAIGDCHFKTSSTLLSQQMSQALLDIAKERTPDIIVMLGDTLDRHETVHTNPLTRAVQFLYQLSLIAPTYLIIGNHDRPNNSDFLSEQHPFTALKYWSNVIVVDKVIKAVIKGLTFIFVPYVPPGRFKEALSTLNEPYNNVHAIFAHQEFRGAKMGAIVSQQGDLWELELPLVISGHIHDYDQPQNNIIYTGTPVQHAFGDREDKTISLFTFYDSRIPWEHERISLALPRKRLIHLDYQQFLEASFNQLEGAEVKIVISANNAQIKNLMKSESVRQLEAKGVKIAYKELIMEEKPSYLTLTGKSYLQKLKTCLETRPDLIELLESILGKIKD